MNTPFRIVIESQEYEQYASVIDPKHILTLPFSNLGQGSIPARNWIWEHSISEGHERHWIIDDNIRAFYRWNDNKRLRIGDSTGFLVIEDFVDRYENVALAGMHYRFFAPSNETRPPFRLNSRVYSCILVQNNLSYRWRGRYNEDTDLSLQVLKANYCTMLFYAFLADKIATLTMKGGNTDELYQGDGRLTMAQSLQEQHPDVVKITRKWGRWQHQVDYRPFKSNRLIKRDDIDIPKGVNNYGMILTNRD
jgi:TET-associated glycosyltransferase-like protein